MPAGTSPAASDGSFRRSYARTRLGAWGLLSIPPLRPTINHYPRHVHSFGPRDDARGHAESRGSDGLLGGPEAAGERAEEVVGDGGRVLRQLREAAPAGRRRRDLA